VTDISGQFVHELYNLNELLGIPGISGIKTGFTDEAGGVLVTSFSQKERTYIIVVLDSVDRFGDTKSVIDGAVEKIKVLPY
jgi:D-alanyl-D-alanine carboxypeptidase